MLTLQNLSDRFLQVANTTSNTSVYHVPALLRESVNMLDIKPAGTYVDATFGGGGHSREILKSLGPEGHLLGFDRDIDALLNAPDDPRFQFVLSDYRFIPNFLRFYGYGKIDGIIADLGVSFHHFDTPERGFSFRADAPLDMRMNAHAERMAKDVLAAMSEEEIREMLISHTDLRNAAAISRKLHAEGRVKPIETTFELAEAVRPLLDPRSVKKDLAQMFQALRIVTNDEINSLKILLENSLRVLKKGGRMAVLTYHSGEDRLVKEFFKNGNFKGESAQDLIYGKSKSPWKPVTRNPLTASEEEILQNPRSRSAKLRVAELK